HYAASSFEKIFIYTMEEVFKEVCKDNIGAEAVAAGLKKIVMTNKGNNKSSHNWASLSEGCLTLDHWLGNADFVHDRSVNAKSVLESSL
ncbi:MAG: hypothetical protein KDD35_07905, partial [Bdellovibrionales bacterium]|nr:hypothetical protein [Bdellovibrionales bacterium]